ncbi:hypothetical protein [Crossiella sp. CA198]|uniref:hypothetical protein n=1 Tax=Crossiella sp. CA198 TaxID=3455607 RepID=UPI003F8D8A3D
MRRIQNAKPVTRSVLAAVAVLALVTGQAGPAAAAPGPAVAAATADQGTPSASPQAKAKAAAAVGYTADELDPLLLLGDRDLVFRLWQKLHADPNREEATASAELALNAATSTAFAACTHFITTGLHEAIGRDIAKEVQNAQAARILREAKRRAAAVLGIVASPELLVLSNRDFIYEIVKRATGPEVKDAALAAFGGTAAQQQAFIDNGLREAYEQQRRREIEEDHQQTEAEKQRLRERDAKARAASVLGIVAGEDVLVLTDDNFVRLIWKRAAPSTEVAGAAYLALLSPAPADWRTFIHTGVHEASKRDLAKELAAKEKADRDRVQEILVKAERHGGRPKLVAAARAALAGTAAQVEDFLRVGQYEVVEDEPEPGPAPSAQVFNDRLTFYGRGADNTLQRWAISAGQSHRQDTVGTGVGGKPAVVAFHNGSHTEQVIFARGLDGSLQHWWTRADGSVAGQDSWGAGLAGDPIAVVHQGVLTVFARGVDGKLLHWWWSPAEGVVRHDNWGDGLGGEPTVVSNREELTVFARGADGSLQHWWWTAGTGLRRDTWGGGIAGNPTALVYRDSLTVFARGTDGSLRHWWLNPADGIARQDSWGGALAGSPVALLHRDELTVFARGADGSLRHWWLSPADGIARQDSWGDGVAGNPAALSDRDQLTVFARGTEGLLQHWWLSPVDHVLRRDNWGPAPLQ